MIVYKPSIPLCISYEDNNFSLKETELVFTSASGGQTETLSVFDPNWVTVDISQAKTEWENSCIDLNNPNRMFIYRSPFNDCCIKIKWSNETDDSRVEYNNSSVVGITYRKGISENSCDGVDCNESETYIMLNQTRKWTKPIKNDIGQDIPTNFYYNKNQVPESLDVEYRFYHLKTVISHEIGHWLGVQHQEGSGCDSYSGIMKKHTIGPKEEISLSDNDKCIFKKLYCCTQTVTVTDVDELTLYPDIKLYPNPVNSNQLFLYVPEKYSMSRVISIHLFGIRGEKINTINLINPSENMIVDISTLTNGVYNLFIQINDIKIFKKLIINR